MCVATHYYYYPGDIVKFDIDDIIIDVIIVDINDIYGKPPAHWWYFTHLMILCIIIDDLTDDVTKVMFLTLQIYLILLLNDVLMIVMMMMTWPIWLYDDPITTVDDDLGNVCGDPIPARQTVTLFPRWWLTTDYVILYYDW